jgi:hypothetical protein
MIGYWPPPSGPAAADLICNHVPFVVVVVVVIFFHSQSIIFYSDVCGTQYIVWPQLSSIIRR